MTDRQALSGTLRLRAAQRAGRTVLIDVSASAPFHIGRGLERLADRGCAVIVQSVGPGQLPGDRLSTDLTASEGSTLVVRGQGANRIYSSPHGEAAIGCTVLRAEVDSTLIALPGEFIPYRDAVLEQRTDIYLDPSSRVAVAEVISAGRVGNDEIHVYSRLDLRTRIWLNNDLMLQERSLLEPSLRPMRYRGRLGNHLVAGTLFLIGQRWTFPPPFAAAGVEWTAGQTDSLILVRLIGDTAQHVNATIQRIITSSGFSLDD